MFRRPVAGALSAITGSGIALFFSSDVPKDGIFIFFGFFLRKAVDDEHFCLYNSIPIGIVKMDYDTNIKKM